MFVNGTSFKPIYKHKCSSCGNEIGYTMDNLLIENKLIPEVGWKVFIYCKCDRCNFLEKISI